MSTLLIFLKGFCMGAADVVPGVSGGTMALVLGIYERLLNAIRSVDMTWLRLVLRGQLRNALARNDLALLVPLALGIATALGFFTRVVPLPKLIVSHPELVYGLFFGLIVASVYVLLDNLRPLSASAWLWLALGVAGGLVVVNLVPTDTPDDTWFVFLCGTVAISAMLLPGISGSFILLMLRKYAYVFDAIGRLDLAIVFPFALGCVVGLMLFSRAISWLLARSHDATLLVICGILVASLWTIWPYQQRSFELVRGKQRLIHSQPMLPSELDSTLAGSIALAVLGACVVVLIHRLAPSREAK